jgi:hypothetical protein
VKPADPVLQISRLAWIRRVSVGLAAYDNVYKAYVTNAGGAAKNVRARLTGWQEGVITVIDGDLNFGDIPAGELDAASEDEFTIRIPINMNSIFDESKLEFTFYYDDVAP